MSLMNKLARKIVKAQRSPGAARATTQVEPAITSVRGTQTTPTVTAPTKPAGASTQVGGPQIAGLTTKGSYHAVHSPKVKRPKGLKYGGRI